MSPRSTSSVLVAAFVLLALAAPALLAAPASAEPNVAAPVATPVIPVGDEPAAPAPAGTVGPSARPILVAPVAEPPRPLAAPTDKPARLRLATRWWFWGSLGGAALGVVLAAIFVRPRDPYTGNATPGTVTIF